MRHGEDEHLLPDPKNDASRHTLVPVYTEMLYQIATDYPGVGNPERLTLSKIRWWYEGLRPGLKKFTKPK